MFIDIGGHSDQNKSCDINKFIKESFFCSYNFNKFINNVSFKISGSLAAVQAASQDCSTGLQRRQSYSGCSQVGPLLVEEILKFVGWQPVTL